MEHYTKEDMREKLLDVLVWGKQTDPPVTLASRFTFFVLRQGLTYPPMTSKS